MLIHVHTLELFKYIKVYIYTEHLLFELKTFGEYIIIEQAMLSRYILIRKDGGCNNL